MKFSLTMFKNIFDNETSRQYKFNSLEKFENMFYELSSKDGYKPKKGENPWRKSSPLISPASYKPETTRSNENVLGWNGWTALDIDSVKTDLTIEEFVQNLFGKYYYICYSTPSSKRENPKFRIVLPFDGIVNPEKISHFWFSVNKEFNNVVDKQTKDLSRMYYIPGVYPEAYQFIFSNRVDTFINPDYLMQKHPYVEKNSKNFLDRLPKDVQDMIIQHRKDKCENNKFIWTSYRDCPFWPKSLEMEYRTCVMTKSVGRYRLLYSIMVSIAGNAIKREYPISSYEIVQLCTELDNSLDGYYKSRNLTIEADRAIEFCYRNN